MLQLDLNLVINAINYVVFVASKDEHIRHTKTFALFQASAEVLGGLKIRLFGGSDKIIFLTPRGAWARA